MGMSPERTQEYAQRLRGPDLLDRSEHRESQGGVAMSARDLHGVIGRHGEFDAFLWRRTTTQQLMVPGGEQAVRITTVSESDDGQIELWRGEPGQRELVARIPAGWIVRAERPDGRYPPREPIETIDGLELHSRFTPGTPVQVRLPDGTEHAITGTTWDVGAASVRLRTDSDEVHSVLQWQLVDVMAGLPPRPDPGTNPIAPLAEMDEQIAQIIGRDGLDDMDDNALWGLAGDYGVERGGVMRWQLPFTPEQRQSVIAGMRARGAINPEVYRNLSDQEQQQWERRQVQLDQIARGEEAEAQPAATGGIPRDQYNAEVQDAAQILLSVAHLAKQSGLSREAAGPILRNTLRSDYGVETDYLADWADRDAVDIIADWLTEYDGAIARGDQPLANDAIDQLASYTGLSRAFQLASGDWSPPPSLPQRSPARTAAPIPTPPDDQLPLGAQTIGEMFGLIAADGQYRFQWIPVGPELERRIRRIWEFDDPGSGLRTEVTSIQGGLGNIITIRGQVYDENSRQVANWTRSISHTDDGEIRVYHEYFRMNREVQGGGFTSRWFEQALTRYREEDFSWVKVDANLDVGGYTWTHWFDFDSSGKAELLLADLRSRINRGEWTITPQTDREVAELLAAARRGEWVSARQVAMIGYGQRMTGDPDIDTERDQGFILPTRPDGSSMEMWLGKRFMLNQSWGGAMRL